ncbi:MOSC domain-containing protein [Paeniglutamicibacter sp. ABSL32-1]|uniref:MOSC domain-containing protein n=1 Tax=Paeniglutamicibacter quisquiliarum TaxID=2849498 RepID=UPI001C2DD16A|nr:MOSC domain-containing protein [Paeniglutamicibacter quisquiliarum]MBV1779880.1 MOSC domain-containing protein [Paeniglutamicibacter quisquiliarum]
MSISPEPGRPETVPVATGTLEAVCVVHALKPDAGPVGTTAIDKRPIDGPVKVRKMGLYADVQVDREHHGGHDQAVYAYSQAEAGRWGGELGREIQAGLFGENLRVSGIDTTDAVVGERWAIGKSVVLEVTCPRIPCSTFARHLGEENWVRRFTERGDVGCFLKVVRTGKIGAGEPIAVISRPEHGVRVRDIFVGPTPEQAERLLEYQHASGRPLPAKVLRTLPEPEAGQ